MRGCALTKRVRTRGCINGLSHTTRTKIGTLFQERTLRVPGEQRPDCGGFTGTEVDSKKRTGRSAAACFKQRFTNKQIRRADPNIAAPFLFLRALLQTASIKLSLGYLLFGIGQSGRATEAGAIAKA